LTALQVRAPKLQLLRSYGDSGEVNNVVGQFDESGSVGDNKDSAGLRQFRDCGDDQGFRFNVECSSWLIQQNESGLLTESPSERHPTSLPRTQRTPAFAKHRGNSIWQLCYQMGQPNNFECAQNIAV